MFPEEPDDDLTKFCTQLPWIEIIVRFRWVEKVTKVFDEFWKKGGCGYRHDIWKIGFNALSRRRINSNPFWNGASVCYTTGIAVDWGSYKFTRSTPRNYKPGLWWFTVAPRLAQSCAVCADPMLTVQPLTCRDTCLCVWDNILFYNTQVKITVCMNDSNNAIALLDKQSKST